LAVLQWNSSDDILSVAPLFTGNYNTLGTEMLKFSVSQCTLLLAYYIFTILLTNYWQWDARSPLACLFILIYNYITKNKVS